MSYYDKYIKYKMKYLSLKGGSYSKLRLPCEITYNVKILYVPLKNKYKILDLRIIEYANIIDNILTGQFCQDPVILLKDENNKNYGIIIKNDEIYKDKPLEDKQLEDKYFNIIDHRFKINPDNGNNYGGNFISAPNDSVFCFSGLDEQLYNYLNKNLINGLVQLNCSFRFNNERHIDECMCFMPYGSNSFKIWIYRIRNIYNSDNIIQCDVQKINEEIKKYNIDINKYDRDQKNKLYILLCSSKLDIKNIYHELIDGLDDDIKKIFTPNKILDIKKNLIVNYSEIKKILTLPSINVEDIKDLLEKERQYNLELISSVIFDEPYIEKKDRFVEFPIDLQKTDSGYRIINIPIFNRVCIKKSDKFTFLFSTNGDLDSEVKSIFDEEKDQMNPDNNYHFINISDSYNTMNGNVGGGLHCLIKNGY